MQMKNVLSIAIPGGIIATLILWWIGENLSSDALSMAIGMVLGTLAGVPSAALIFLALHRGDQDGNYIDAPTYQNEPTVCVNPPTIYADEVTMYSHMFRKAIGLPPLPERQAPPQPADIEGQIEELEPYLAHLKTRRHWPLCRRLARCWRYPMTHSCGPQAAGKTAPTR